MFIQANVRIAVYREKSSLRLFPVIEAIVVTAVTAIISFLVSQMEPISLEMILRFC